MSESGGETDSEPDLDTLTRRAAEARLLADVSGRCSSDGNAAANDTAASGDVGTIEERVLRAAERGDTALLRQLLQQDGALARCSDDDGYTPLHRAAYNEREAAAAALLTAGADTAARTDDGWTPLHSAARWNAAACARLLLLHGADVNATTAGGLTPLMVAASNGEARDTCLLLLQTPGVRLDTTNASGDGAADLAARSAAITPLFELAEDYMTDI